MVLELQLVSRWKKGHPVRPLSRLGSSSQRSGKHVVHSELVRVDTETKEYDGVKQNDIDDFARPAVTRTWL